MKFSQRFFELLHETCHGRGVQKKLAEKTGISQPNLSKIFNGEVKDPGLSAVSSIMDALGIGLCTNGQSGDCYEVERDLLAAYERIKELEQELHFAKGEISGLQCALDKAMNQLTGQNTQEKSNVFPKTGIKLNQDVG